jgi:hypothetical protein
MNGAADPQVPSMDSHGPERMVEEALKASLLSARSIVYSNPAAGGPVGVYLAKLLDLCGCGSQPNLF